MNSYENYRKLAESGEEGFDLVRETLEDEFIDFVKYCLLHAEAKSFIGMGDKLRTFDVYIETLDIHINWYSDSKFSASNSNNVYIIIRYKGYVRFHKGYENLQDHVELLSNTIIQFIETYVTN